MNYYNEIKNKLIDNEVYKRVKNYSKNRNDLSTYYEVGKLLFEAGDHYGEGIIRDYSKRLTLELGRGYSKRNLWLMLKFYKLNEKVQTLSAELTWSHYIELLSLENTNEINYYISIIEGYNLSVRELRERIKNKEYERLPMETKNKMINEYRLEMKDLIPNPILIKNKNNIEVVNEMILHNLILENMNLYNCFFNSLNNYWYYLMIIEYILRIMYLVKIITYEKILAIYLEDSI